MAPHLFVHSESVHQSSRGKYLGDFVYGANDGIITTFAVVSGAAGATLAPGIILILGLANLFGDGISMGLSNFLSLRSRRDFERKQRSIEEREIEEFPDEERKEVADILRRWGIPEARIGETVIEITKDKKRWTDLMMIEELKIIEMGDGSPARHGLATMGAFVVAGALPLIPYLFGIPAEFQFIVSIIATAVSLFIVGAARTIVTDAPWFRSGLEMLLVGGLAATAAYGVGAAVKTMFGIII